MNQVTVALLAIYLIWGSTYLGIHYALESFPPLALSGSRFLAAGLLVYGLLGRRAVPATMRHWLSAAWVGLFMLVAGNGLVTWAELTVTSGQTAVLLATTPLWMTLWSAWKKGYPGHATVAGLGLSTWGVTTLMSEPGQWSWGVLAILLAALGWAVGSVLSTVLPKPAGTVQFSAMTMICSGLMLGVLSLARGEAFPTQVTPVALAAWLYLTVLGSVVGLTAYTWLLHNASATLVATHTYVNPMVAVGLAYLAGEALPAQMPMGATLIVLGVALISLQGVRWPERLFRPYMPLIGPVR